MLPGPGEFPIFFVIAFVVAAAFILSVGAFVVTSLVRSRRVLRDSGLDPLAAPAQIAVRLARGPLATSTKSLEERLAELDDLRRRGLITEAEHHAARSAALNGQR
jgi:hypothetical protein